MNMMTSTTERALIAETKCHYEASQAALRKGCEHALLAGIRLMWLHVKTAQSPNGARVSHETRLGFEGALREIGIRRATAYRWMNAAAKAATRATLMFEGDALEEVLPEPGTPKWERWEKTLSDTAQGMGLNRLILGTERESTEVQRLSDLTDAVEEGRQRAIELMQAVEDGKYTLSQAIRALGSQEAYDRLRQEGGEKVRKDPVYLDIDPKTGELTGLVPKSLKTISNAFERWDHLPAPARSKVRDLWLAVVTQTPRDLEER